MNKEFPQLCCTCLSLEGEMKNIYNDGFILEKSTIYFSSILMSCTGIKMDLFDCLSSKICNKCAAQAVQFYLFKQKCKESYETLISMLNSQKCLENKGEITVDNNEFNMIANIKATTYFKNDKYNLGDDRTCYKEENANLGEDLNKSRNVIEIIDNNLTKGLTLRTQKLCNIRKVHNRDPEMLKMKEQSRRIKKLHTCKICSREFSRNNSLIIHMKSHKPRVMHKYKCPHPNCEKEFSQKGAVNVHLLKHRGEKRFLCNECGKSFYKLYNLQMHIKSHKGEKPFSCPHCGKCFASTSSANYHIKSHTGVKSYICDICGKDFFRVADLTVHHNFHLGIKPVQCSLCLRRLATTSHLIVHMRTHTGEKPHSCAICGRSFATRSTLSKHTLTHTGEKPYVCNICGRAFSQRGSLKTHMKTHSDKS